MYELILCVCLSFLQLKHSSCSLHSTRSHNLTLASLHMPPQACKSRNRSYLRMARQLRWPKKVRRSHPCPDHPYRSGEKTLNFLFSIFFRRIASLSRVAESFWLLRLFRLSRASPVGFLFGFPLLLASIPKQPTLFLSHYLLFQTKVSWIYALRESL